MERLKLNDAKLQRLDLKEMEQTEQDEMEDEKMDRVGWSPRSPRSPRPRTPLGGDHQINASVLFRKQKSPRGKNSHNLTYNFGGGAKISNIDALSIHQQDSVFENRDAIAVI